MPGMACHIPFMPDRSSKRPSDQNQLAKLMVDIASGEVNDGWVDPHAGKNPAAVALGRLGGAKGGPARASSMTAERRKEIAREAAKKRWENRQK
jgi:hypothetical protein